MDLKKGIFKGSSRQIAKDLKTAVESSNRTKGTKFSSAMSMLNFEINRAGSNLSPERKKTLESAKTRLRREFKKPVRGTKK